MNTAQRTEPVRVLIAGVSTRAAAESAARAGYAVTSIDAFGDLDQHPSVRALSLPRDFDHRFTAAATARAARRIECDAVVYLSSFENHPRAVGTLAAGRALWGNAPAVLRHVRDPVALAGALQRRGLAAPRVHDPAGKLFRLPFRRATTGSRWLVKPLASGGGRRVRPWRYGTRLPRGCYIQEFVDGPLGSLVFAAAGGRAVPFAVTRQLVGEQVFGAAGYRYCGNILAAAGDPQFARDEALVDQACALAGAIAEEFGLVGINGLDFVARDGVPFAIEVNPRWSGSAELVERVYGLSVFGAHAVACAAGGLPRFDLASARHGAGATGKAVVFARRDVVVGDTRAWLGGNARAGVRDVPCPGEPIRAGRPVCTVFATGRDSVACHAELVRRAEQVHAQLAAWARSVA